MVLYYQM